MVLLFLADQFLLPEPEEPDLLLLEPEEPDLLLLEPEEPDLLLLEPEEPCEESEEDLESELLLLLD